MSTASRLRCAARTIVRETISLVTSCVVVMASMLVLPASQASAAPVALTITPLTWNMIGLDSNTPATGPYRVPVGVRVCNVPGGDTATGVVVDFGWDSANAFINLRPGSLSSISLAPVVGGSCADAYFEAEVTKTTAAFDTTRRPDDDVSRSRIVRLQR